jgi:hypothetical protein
VTVSVGADMAAAKRALSAAFSESPVGVGEVARVRKEARIVDGISASDSGVSLRFAAISGRGRKPQRAIKGVSASQVYDYRLVLFVKVQPLMVYKNKTCLCISQDVRCVVAQPWPCLDASGYSTPFR